mgnify:CR=1 FL=1
MNASTDQNLHIGLSKVFFRMLIGFFSGLIGTMILGIILFIAWGVVGDTIQEVRFSPSKSINPAQENTEVHPLFLNFITLAMFLSSLAATICYGAMKSNSEGRQATLTTTLTHIFIGNLVILVMMLPLYFSASEMDNQTGIVLSTIVHAVMACMHTYMSMEIIHEDKHLIVHLFGVIFGVALFCWISTFVISNLSVFIFLTLPLLLSMIAGGSTIVQMFYQWIQAVYGEDYLHNNRKFGGDFANEQTDEVSFDDI